MKNIRIPIGIEFFETIRKNNFYYVDKTGFIKELLEDTFQVNLFTRPRRFGKTLMLTMLEQFFDIQKNSKELFEGLEIVKHKEICKEWMNQWPVLFLSLKDLSGLKFQNAYEQLKFDISSLCIKHDYLLESSSVNESDKEYFSRLKFRTGTEEDVRNSLLLLCRMLYTHYGKQIILLIDEYDVPLAKASENGYYKEMLELIRGIMSSTLKTNEFLKMAVITGCLRIAKESIFTGTNHFKVNSMEGPGYLDKFGFTEEEVLKVLSDSGCSFCADTVKKWYDGYRFGKYEIYCPWDVVNYVNDLQINPEWKPKNYWKNTSHNSIIRSFIGNENLQVSDQLETLLAGGSVQVSLCEDLSYDFESSSEDNFWSILYLTGYLTKIDQKDCSREEKVQLYIPNQEIKTIFADTIAEWFQDTMKAQNREELFLAWWSGDDKKLTELVSEILFDSISYFDYKEDYYHAFTAGLFVGAGYQVSSNQESGLGRADIIVKDKKNRRAIVIEVKHSDSEQKLEKDCEKAILQIETKQYAKSILKGYKSVFCYGAAFYEKSCKIVATKHLF